MEFVKFPSIARLSRDIVITEKLDGTNAAIHIEGSNIQAASRNKFITPEDDNYGFAKWVERNKEELLTLGDGVHFGEWWGNGIQIGYGLKEKRFSLFNVNRWGDDTVRPACCGIVPVLYVGEFNTETINMTLDYLKTNGSVAAPGFMNPEGIVIYHKHSGTSFKKTIKNDEAGKSYGS